MNLESKKLIIDKSAKEIYNFLTEVKNFKKLMPDGVNKFELLNNNEFIFGLNGMPEITLIKKLEIPTEKIVFESSAEKLDFSLEASVNSLESNKSEIQLKFNGKFNPMMAMMIKGPISKFIEILAINIPKSVQ
tara:strand:- start:497 stop:895 length:399 start_codon:yes stop_codon:yes gene_type:complete